MSAGASKLGYMLARVQKPARYLGNEWNSVHKDHDLVAVKMVLAFPDLYEVGMSNQGLKILYECVNNRPDQLMERVFAPAADMEELIRQQGQLLCSLESQTPLNEFDLIGFSLQYELSYTNVLNMLDLASIPLYSIDRKDNDPLVIGGGPSVFNPEPLASFFDLFLLGEAEEALPELLDCLAELKKQNLGKKEILSRLSSVEGVYVPSFYEPLYSDGKLCGMKQIHPGAPDVIKKRVIADLDSVPYPTAPVVPYIQTVHDRAVVELFRGCGRGCRFCQAGFIFRPVRRRSRRKIIELSKNLLSATGYDEISLSSLSSSDYPDIDVLIDEMGDLLDGGKIRCSLPSLRLDSYSVKLADQLHQGRRSSLTFAPEAATERLRRVINKNITEEDIFSALSDAVKAGWQGFKLYFMIGLPTEEDADVEAIISLCHRIRQHFKSRGARNLNITVSVATFIPKAHTPFQWEPQLTLAKVIERQQALRRGFKKMPGIDFSWHEAEASFIEAVFARGDRRLASLLEKAWQSGCRFDGWSEYFSYDLWEKAFKELDIDAKSYACRRYEYDDYLPWDHLQSGINKEFFIREHQKALGVDSAAGSGSDAHSV